MNDNGSALKDKATEETVAPILEEFGRRRDMLIPILQRIQQDLAYLPRRGLEMVAEHLEISATEVYGVATFYNQFRFHPPGLHQIHVCMGTACHVVGGEVILENFERKLGVKVGETTPDGRYSVHGVACVGCCALAPVAVVDGRTEGHMAPSRVEGILLGFQIEKEREERERGEGDPGE